MGDIVVDVDGEVADAQWVNRTEAALGPRQLAIEQLEVAAVCLRDAELAYKQAGLDYRSALDRFNAIVAPLPK